jgi:hypothetical protein
MEIWGGGQCSIYESSRIAKRRLSTLLLSLLHCGVMLTTQQPGKYIYVDSLLMISFIHLLYKRRLKRKVREDPNLIAWLLQSAFNLSRKNNISPPKLYIYVRNFNFGNTH